MDNSTDPIMQTRLDVAEMKGMLTTIVSTHEARLIGHDSRIDGHESRLNDKAKILARLDERLDDTEEDILALRADNTARYGRNLSVLGLVISGTVALLAVNNYIQLG